MKYEEAKVLDLPINEDEEPYTLQFTNTKEIVQLPSHHILDADPLAKIPDTINEQPEHPIKEAPWITDG